MSNLILNVLEYDEENHLMKICISNDIDDFERTFTYNVSSWQSHSDIDSNLFGLAKNAIFMYKEELKRKEFISENKKNSYKELVGKSFSYNIEDIEKQIESQINL
jgi:hypothetical protein